MIPESPSPQEAAVYRKVTWRLIPLLFSCYILAYIDRVNVGFAKLSMKTEAWFTDAVFATGAGIFFLGYFFFEVPGNVILHRVGARIWIARIMIGWGFVSGAMAFSYSETSFYALRFLLGVAEAGFFPGIILYLTYWYPRRRQAHMVALFMTAIAVSGVIGSPLSGWLLKITDGWHGLPAWKWLFILEAIPTVLLGIAVPFLLSDRPAKAKWLTPQERDLLESNLAADEKAKAAEGHGIQGLLGAFKSSKIWICCGIYFGAIVGLYGTSFWLPQIIKDTLTQDEFKVGLYSMIPWGCAAIGMVLVGRHSDRTGERRWHIGLSSTVAAIAFSLSGLPGLPAPLVLAMMAVALTGVMSSISCFWTLPTAMLSGTAAAVGIAGINSIGNLAGFVGPKLIDWLKTPTPNFLLPKGLVQWALENAGHQLAMNGVAAFLAMSGILAIFFTRPIKAQAPRP
ncbi:MFS transporter [Prosthecobacter algae]